MNYIVLMLLSMQVPWINYLLLRHNGINCPDFLRMFCINMIT